MANKNYTEFAAGSYDPTRILLTANPGTGALAKVALSSLLGFKMAIVELVQTGTSNPVINVTYNTLGGALSAVRNGVGNYSITSAGLFTVGQTYTPPFDKDGWVYLALGQATAFDHAYNLFASSANEIVLTTYTAAFVPAELSDITGGNTMVFFIFVLE